MNECITTTQNYDSNVYIQIGNYGGFLAEFYIDYIQANGTNHSLDSGMFSLGFSRRLYISKGTPIVKLKVEIWILGVIKILYDNYIETKTSSCFGLYYSIFNPSMERIPCNSIAISPNDSNCCCCCPCQNYRCCNSCYRC